MTPTFCPYRGCGLNRSFLPTTFRSHGSYPSAARGRRVRRFRCPACERTFSEATFLYSFRQKKPGVDSPLIHLICRAVSLRDAARLLRINRKTVSDKLRRAARHSRRLHDRLLRNRLLGDFQLDELETFESNRFRPLSVPVLIERSCYFIVTTDTAPLRRKGRMTPTQRFQQRRIERRHGPRPTRSDHAVSRCLRRLRWHVRGRVSLESDRKPSYGRMARRILGPGVEHRTHDSRRRRDRSNPLFPINHTNAMLRYGLARLRRRTWCVTRRRRWLQMALDVYLGWFNYCRGITIRTERSPAQAMGLAWRKILVEEWLEWRQDWHNAARILPDGILPIP